MSIHRDEIRRILYEETQLLDLYGNELADAIAGHLICSNSRGITYYYQCISKNGKTKRKSLTGNTEAIKELARKEFLRQSIGLLKNNISLLEDAERGYCDYDLDSIKVRMRKAYMDLPADFFLTPSQGGRVIYHHADKASIERHVKWAEQPYEKSTYMPEGLKHPTSAGIKVRSKSEQHIVEQLVNYGVPFRYEQVLHFGSVTMSADFTFEDYRHEEFYWEHAGMMAEDYYRSGHRKKMDTYEANGIVPWENLIVTYDSDGSVNIPLIKSIIEDEIIPRL